MTEIKIDLPSTVAELTDFANMLIRIQSGIADSDPARVQSLENNAEEMINFLADKLGMDVSQLSGLEAIEASLARKCIDILLEGR